MKNFMIRLWAAAALLVCLGGYAQAQNCPDVSDGEAISAVLNDANLRGPVIGFRSTGFFFEDVNVEESFDGNIVVRFDYTPKCQTTGNNSNCPPFNQVYGVVFDCNLNVVAIFIS